MENSGHHVKEVQRQILEEGKHRVDKDYLFKLQKFPQTTATLQKRITEKSDYIGIQGLSSEF